MSKKPLQTKLFKKFQDDEIHAFTHRPSIQTDKLIEESINSDLSFSKEDSFSITNLKQDWDSIKVLQADIKKTSEKLKKLGNHPPRPLSECAKTGKIEKKTKNEGVSGKELKKTQDKCKNLAAVLAQCEKEK